MNLTLDAFHTYNCAERKGMSTFIKISTLNTFIKQMVAKCCPLVNEIVNSGHLGFGLKSMFFPPIKNEGSNAQIRVEFFVGTNILLVNMFQVRKLC